ncbi:MAG: hypothetical protein IKV72_02315, partial [Firmicutes bacterium]|nr:hypothetical protein [Bacillota bacterium]
VVSGYTSGTPVVYNYDCGTDANGKVILNVTLNIEGYTAEVPETDEEAVPPVIDTDKSDSAPETGDDFNVGLWVAMIILAGGVMLAAVRRTAENR